MLCCHVINLYIIKRSKWYSSTEISYFTNRTTKTISHKLSQLNPSQLTDYKNICDKFMNKNLFDYQSNLSINKYILGQIEANKDAKHNSSRDIKLTNTYYLHCSNLHHL